MKQQLLAIAEILDAYRILPRLFMAGYGWLVYDTELWFRSIESPTAVHGAAHATVWGAAAIITAWYLNTGRKWQ